MKLPLLHVQLSFSVLRTIIKIIIWQVPATLLFTYQDFIEEIYRRENNPSEQRAQSHNIRLVFNGIRNPGRYCAIKHISCEKPKQNKPLWKPSHVLFNRVAERTYYKTSNSRISFAYILLNFSFFMETGIPPVKLLKLKSLQDQKNESKR
jgi:hypothetical protein